MNALSKIINIRIPNTFIGPGSIKNIGDIIKDLSPSKILIVTDPNIKEAGIIDPVRSLLEKTGYVSDVYDGCESNASTSSLERLSQKVRSGRYDLLIGIGGGSAMDATKVASQLAANDDLSIHDLLNGKVAPKVMAKVLIPTTAGSGSEWSFVAMVSDEESGKLKKAITSARNIPDAVIVDPELTLNLPQKVTAETGMDVLVHAIESYTNCKANVISDMLALTALKLASDNIRQAFSKGKQNIEARYNMSVAASLAMGAVALSGVGMAHLSGHPLEKRSHITHGTSCTLMLPYVIEFNLMACPEKFAKIAEAMGEATSGLSVFDAAAKSVPAVRKLSRALGMPQTLRDIGINQTQIEAMVEELFNAYGSEIRMWNPRDVSREDAAKIYTAALPAPDAPISSP
jgi:alcohol dehydrogenase class IV